MGCAASTANALQPTAKASTASPPPMQPVVEDPPCSHAQQSCMHVTAHVSAGAPSESGTKHASPVSSQQSLVLAQHHDQPSSSTSATPGQQQQDDRSSCRANDDDEDDSGVSSSGGSCTQRVFTPTMNINAQDMKQHLDNLCSVSAVNERPPQHLSRRAVDLDWLLGPFLSEHPEILAERLTTAEVVERIIKPATAPPRCCSYVNVLLHGDQRQRAAVSNGEAFYFISHTWSRPFSELLELLRRHFDPVRQRMWRPGHREDEHCDVYVWLDILAMNQHKPEVTAFDALLLALQEVVSDAEKTLMVLDGGASILTRIWCLYEAWQTHRKGRSKVVMLTYSTTARALQEAFTNLDVGRAKATCASDLRHILNAIEQDVGVTAMTAELKSALLRSVVSAAPTPEDLLYADADVDMADDLAKAAAMCVLVRELDEAEAMYWRALGIYEAELGPCHVSVVAVLDELLELRRSLGKSVVAVRLRRFCPASGQEDRAGEQLQAHASEVRAAQGCSRQDGDSDDELSDMNNEAVQLYCRGQHAAAGALLQRVLEGYEALQRPCSAFHALMTISNLGPVLEQLGMRQRAEQLYRRAVDGWSAMVGEDDPLTLSSTHNLAKLLATAADGRAVEAEALFRRAVDGAMRVLGPRHADTIDSVEHLERLLQTQGRGQEIDALLSGFGIP